LECLISFKSLSERETYWQDKTQIINNMKKTDETLKLFIDTYTNLQLGYKKGKHGIIKPKYTQNR